MKKSLVYTLFASIAAAAVFFSYQTFFKETSYKVVLSPEITVEMSVNAKCTNTNVLKLADSIELRPEYKDHLKAGKVILKDEVVPMCYVTKDNLPVSKAESVMIITEQGDEAILDLNAIRSGKKS